MVILRNTDGEEVKRYETTDRFRDCIRVNSMSLSDMDFTGEDFSFLDLSKCNPHRSWFMHCRFVGCDLRYVDWTDVIADYADFSGTQQARGSFYRASLRNTRWHNADFGECGASFAVANLSFADFRGAIGTDQLGLVGTCAVGANWAGCKWPPLAACFGEGSDIDCIDTSLLVEHTRHSLLDRDWSYPSNFHLARALWAAVFNEHQAFDHARGQLSRTWAESLGATVAHMRIVALAAIHPATPFRPQSRSFRDTLKDILQVTIGVNVGGDLLEKLRKLEKSKTATPRRKPKKVPRHATENGR